MATLTVSLTGSAIVTGSKSYTVSDTDVQSVLDLMSNSMQFASQTPTNQQLLSGWVQAWIDRTKLEVQRLKTIIPPPITFG